MGPNKAKRLLRKALWLAVFFAGGLCADGSASDAGVHTKPLQPAAFNYTGTYTLRQIDPNLTGAGVIIAVASRSATYLDGHPQNDYQPNLSHDCFAGSLVSFMDGPNFSAGISEHSTAIGGILAGTDPNGFHPQVGDFCYEGAGPDMVLDVYEFWRFVSSYVYGGKWFDADILTISVGVTFEDWWTRGIERIVESDGLIVVAGIGNGSSVFDPVLYPAAGANVIGVGVVDSVENETLSNGLREFSLPRSTHSSCGPTSDGRCKPDIVAPGNCLVPAAGSATGYEISGDWVSFATPVVTGTIALLVQKAQSEPALALAVARPGGNCVMKAIVMNSATKLPYWHKGAVGKEDDHKRPLDYAQGAGVLNATGAYAQLIAGPSVMGNVGAVGWDSNIIEKSMKVENVYRIEGEQAEGSFITATLVWNRHYEQEYPFAAALAGDSDLRLELWAMDPNDPQGSYLIDYSDSVNDNVEHIHHPVDPNCIGYEIVVSYGDISGAQAVASTDLAPENYALAWQVRPGDTKENIRWYDLNGDGKVDNLDFAISLNNIKNNVKAEDEYLPGDIDMNGTVDIKELVELLKHID